MTIIPEVRALEELFEDFNACFFGGELQRPVLTFSSDTTRGAYGWFTLDTVWIHLADDAKANEINICCDQIESPEQVAKTLLHEMVHQYNFMKGVKDCSRGGSYHNTKFRDACLEHGLDCHQSAKYGWCECTLQEEARQIAEPYFEYFGMKRERDKTKRRVKTRTSSTRKYECPCCGLSVRATKEVRIMCYECQELMLCDED